MSLGKHSRNDFLNHALGKQNVRVTVPTNPYGGQCVAFVDYLLQYQTGGKYNLAYTNAIDLLDRARAQGLQVVYFNGHNYDWEPGDIWVTRTTAHIYGHTGIFLTPGDYPKTLEQNVDGNWDALYNGGFVRYKGRTVYDTTLMAYNDIFDTQYLVGWIKLPVAPEGPSSEELARIEAEKKRKERIKKGGSMYGSYFFSVKEGDALFGKGTIYFYNAAINAVSGLKHPDEVKVISEKYKNDFGEDIKSVVYTNSAPWHMRLFEGLKTDVRYQGNKDAEILKAIKQLPGEATINEIFARVSDTSVGSDLTIEQKEFNIVGYSKFKALNDITIRSTASTKAKSLGVLKKGSSVKITGSALSDGWYWVQFTHNGKEAYAVSKKQGGDITGELIK